MPGKFGLQGRVAFQASAPCQKKASRLAAEFGAQGRFCPLLEEGSNCTDVRNGDAKRMWDSQDLNGSFGPFVSTKQ